MQEQVKRKNNKKKILFLTQYFPPDVTAASFRMSETARLFAGKGFSVRILTARPHREQSVNEELHNLLPESDIIRAPILKVKILRSGKLGYIVHYFSFMIFSFIWGIFKTQDTYDYILASSPPLFIGIPGLLLSKIKRAKFVLDIRDIWPDFAVSAGMLSDKGFLYNFGKRLEKFLYHKANLITSVSNPMRKYIKKFVNGRCSVEVIYNGIDTGSLTAEILGTIDDKSLMGNSPEDFIVTYLGNMGMAQGLETLIYAAEILKERGFNNIKLAFIGGGTYRPFLEQEVENRKLENVIFTGPFDKNTAFSYMMKSSALIVHLKKSDILGLTIPSKVFDYLYANKPILYGIEGEGRKILSSLEGNLYFEPGNPYSLSHSIIELYENYTELLNHSQGNRGYLVNNFSRNKMGHKLLKALHRLK